MSSTNRKFNSFDYFTFARFFAGFYCYTAKNSCARM